MRFNMTYSPLPALRINSAYCLACSSLSNDMMIVGLNEL